MKVTLNDRRVMDAKVIGTDKLTDLAVIKIDGHDLPSLQWGDSSTLKPGRRCWRSAARSATSRTR